MNCVKQVVECVLSEGWVSASSAAKDLLSAISTATAQTLEQVRSHLLPTPLKCHYSFDMRDIMRVAEGLLMADTTHLTDGSSVARSAGFFSKASRLQAVCTLDRARLFSRLALVVAVATQIVGS